MVKRRFACVQRSASHPSRTHEHAEAEIVVRIATRSQPRTAVRPMRDVRLPW